jgi:hypothetical protein
MISLLRNYIGKPIHVSSPLLFGGKAPCVFRLTGVEEGGVWLAGTAASGPLLPEDFVPKDTGPFAQIFVPFAQIAYIGADPTSPHHASSPPPSEPAANAPRRGLAPRRRH